MIIWANHNIRASITAMREVSKNILEHETLNNVEGKIVPVNEIFKLQGDDELRIAEKKYLPTSGNKVNALILAASKGKEFGDITKDIPKTMLKVKDKSILDWQVASMSFLGLKDIFVVCGYKEDQIKIPKIKKIINKDFESTTDLFSLYLGIKNIDTDLIISYGDIIYKEHVLHSLLNNQNDMVIVADRDFRKKGVSLDYVQIEGDFKDFFNKITLKNIFSSNSLITKNKSIDAEFIGLWKIKKKIIPKIIGIIENWENLGLLSEKTIIDLLNELKVNDKVFVNLINGSWIDIDTLLDLKNANTI